MAFYRPKERKGLLASLNVAIGALDLAKQASCISPAKALFGSVIVLLSMIKVCLFLSCGNQLQADASRIQ